MRAARRARRTELLALARWEQRCERELDRWRPLIQALQELAIADNNEGLMYTISEGLRAFQTIAQRSSGAAPWEWSRSRAAIDWRALRMQARNLFGRDPLSRSWAYDPTADGGEVDW